MWAEGVEEISVNRVRELISDNIFFNVKNVNFILLHVHCLHEIYDNLGFPDAGAEVCVLQVLRGAREEVAEAPAGQPVIEKSSYMLYVVI